MSTMNTFFFWVFLLSIITIFLYNTENPIKDAVLGKILPLDEIYDGKWRVIKEKDALTDEVSTKAYHQYPINGGKIEAIAMCEYDKDNSLLGKRISFQFNMFSDDKSQPKKYKNSSSIVGLLSTYNQSLLLNASGVSANPVEFDYRLDDRKVRKWYSNSEYYNVAKLSFFEASRISALPAYGIMIPQDSESLENLLNAKTLRLKLPVNGENPIDIFIELTDLKGLIVECLPSNNNIRNNTDNQLENNLTIPNTSEVKATDKSKGKKSPYANTQNLKNDTKSNCSDSKKSSVDILICADEELVELDNNLTRSYQRLMEAADEANKSKVKEKQSQWKRNRGESCNLQPFTTLDERGSNEIIYCLKHIYKERIKALDALTEYKNKENSLEHSSSPDSIRAQFARCWSPPTGAYNANNVTVVVNAEFNIDGSYKNAEIVDELKGRYNSDSFFRAVSDAALRAVRQCSPLRNMNPNAYDEWRYMEMRFDSRNMN